MINPAEFNDIKIVGLDTQFTSESARGSAMRNMHLRLSASAPQEWIEIFEGERAFPRHSMWREAHVSGNHIVVDCVPGEIEQYHLRDLKTDVANTNQKYRDYLSRVAQVDEHQRQATADEQQRLTELRDRLDFS